MQCTSRKSNKIHNSIASKTIKNHLKYGWKSNLPIRKINNNNTIPIIEEKEKEKENDIYTKIYYEDNKTIKYYGDIKKSKKNNYGKYYYKNTKIKYEGFWLNNKLDGYGKYYYKNESF